MEIEPEPLNRYQTPTHLPPLMYKYKQNYNENLVQTARRISSCSPIKVKPFPLDVLLTEYKYNFKKSDMDDFSKYYKVKVKDPEFLV